MLIALAMLLLLGAASPTHAWSAVGHELVATIAQAHLSPRTLDHVRAILPTETGGHLAAVAAWADTVRNQTTGPLHYINALSDAPPHNCSFSPPWTDKDGTHNVVSGVQEFSRRVQAGEGDIPLRFLTHFVGDLHQPLHLCGRLRGGNGLRVLFEGRGTSLHALWDGVMLQRSIRELGNYTTAGPSPRVERALRGRIYDPLVRFIVYEGIRGFWRAESLTWASCPAAAQTPAPSLASPLTAAPAEPIAARKTLPAKPPVVDVLMRMLGVPEVVYVNLLPQWVLDLGASSPRGPVPAVVQPATADETIEGEPDVPGCPWTWAAETHPLNCAYVWPPVDAPVGVELATPEYWGRVKGDLVVERQLAMAGIRLAAILNSIFDSAVNGAAGSDLGLLQSDD